MARRNAVPAGVDLEGSFIDPIPDRNEIPEQALSFDTVSASAARESTPTKPRLVWNPPMDEALASIVRETRNAAEVVRRLQSHEAFENFPASIITRLKVGTRLSKLRKLGTNVPKLQATGGGFGPAYVPDVERLNAILAEPLPETAAE